MILPGSYANGFAPRDGQPLYPELWRGCVGAWAPCLGPTGFTLREWSGFGNHGALTNMDAGTDWVTSQGRYALSFDGVNDQIAIAVALSRYMSTAEGSMSAWIRPTGTAPTIANVWLGGFVGDSNGFMSLSRGIIGGLDRIWAYNYDGTEDRVGTEYTVDAWTNIVWVHIGGVLSLYKDGKLAGSVASGSTASLNGLLRIGLMFSSYSTFNGEIDDIRIYSRATNVNQIALLSSRRGIAYEMAPRRRASVQVITGFRPYWIPRRQLIIGGGVQ